MKRQLKTKTELLDYLMHGYIYELEDVQTKKGIQKRLKDNELEQELKIRTKENIKVEDLLVELKLGPAYNRVESPWIQIFSLENKSGTKGRYVGISFTKESNEVNLWIGFGRSAKRQAEIFEQAKEYKVKYSLIEPVLKFGFEYNTENYDAIIINKTISMKDFNEDEFQRDLEYITNLYKAYEERFEHATIVSKKNKDIDIREHNKMNYEEISQRMLVLIEEVGNLAKAIRELK